MSKTTILRPGSLLFKFCEVLFSLLLKEIASWFNLATHRLLPGPNSVIAAGRHPVGGSVVTPILLTPRAYRFCHRNFTCLKHCAWLKQPKFISCSSTLLRL